MVLNDNLHYLYKLDCDTTPIYQMLSIWWVNSLCHSPTKLRTTVFRQEFPSEEQVLLVLHRNQHQRLKVGMRRSHRISQA